MKQWFTVFCLLMIPVLAAPISAQDEMVLAKVDCKAGDLLLIERGKTRLVQLGDRVVYTGTKYMGVYHYFRPQRFDVMMIKDFTGPLHCPIQYAFLTLRPNGEYYLSPFFGHCSNQPETAIKGHTITATFKAFGSMEPATWMFDGENLVQLE